jgi:hypothetical protein
MPSLAKLLLALAATATTLTLAAPTTTSHDITKRATYHPSPATENDYCGEAVPTFLTDASSPLASDCAAIYKAHPGPGYWLVSPAETKANPEGWVRLGASGSCAFEVRLDQKEVVEYRFGTNDLGFYIKSHATEGQGKDGKVEVRSGVWCRRHGFAGPRGGVAWRVVHA